MGRGGCLAWQREGLRPPAAVTVATKSYRDEMDLVGRFIANDARSTRRLR